VHSARWAGAEGSRAERDARNNAKLVAMMRGVPHDRRRARFVCTMCVATPDGAVLVETRGEFEGAIVDEPRGAHGFGYDPHLWLADRGMTSAELPPEVKNELSHRGRAVRRLAYLIHHKRIAW
jgi:XTP/dITP diphosphohydrolase